MPFEIEASWLPDKTLPKNGDSSRRSQGLGESRGMLGIRGLGFWERLAGGLRKAQTEFSLTPRYHETAREKAGASSWFPPDLKFLWGKMWECAMKSSHLGVKERVGFLRKTSSVCPASCLYILLCMWVLSFSNAGKLNPLHIPFSQIVFVTLGPLLPI